MKILRQDVATPTGPCVSDSVNHDMKKFLRI